MFRDHTGQDWDLNDPATYEGEDSWFPKDCRALDANGLRQRIEQEIGRSLYYMVCRHGDFWDKAQHDRVVSFGRFFAREVMEEDRYRNKEWLRKQLFMFLDEVENQC